MILTIKGEVTVFLFLLFFAFLFLLLYYKIRRYRVLAKSYEIDYVVGALKIKDEREYTVQTWLLFCLRFYYLLITVFYVLCFLCFLCIERKKWNRLKTEMDLYFQKFNIRNENDIKK